MKHPQLFRPEENAEYSSHKMAKVTLFHSCSMLVGLNAFEPGQQHALHAHKGQDKLYSVIAGSGLFLLEDRELEMKAGDMLVAPADVMHGIRNSGESRLLVLAVLAPPPAPKGPTE